MILLSDLTEAIAARPSLVVAIVMTLLALLWQRLRLEELPSSVPWVGDVKGKPLAAIRARLQSYVYTSEWLQEGYDKYSKRGQTYILPSNNLGKPELMLPPDKLKWLTDFPDNVMSSEDVQLKVLEAKWAFAFSGMLEHRYHHHIMSKIMPRKLQAKVPILWSTLVDSMDTLWGTDTENWHKLTVYKDVITIISRASNELFVGQPLCKNQDYLDHCVNYTDSVARTFLILNLMPEWMKHIAGPLVAIPTALHSRRARSYTNPIIKQRIADIRKKQEDPSYDWTEPSDYVSWHVNEALAQGRDDELTPSRIGSYIMILNFAAIHTTSFAMANFLIDIAASDPSKKYWASLREEAERVFKEEGQTFTKQSLNKLVRIDSAIRESMRLSGMFARGVTRRVRAKEGVVNSEEGWTAPYDAWISVNVQTVHHDPEIYPNPKEYDAFRFSRPQEEAASDEERDLDDVLKNKNLGIVSTGRNFLPFSHGRHACPGRFFLAMELKMFVAHLVMKYDLEPTPPREPLSFLGMLPMPPLNNTIRIKRRKDMPSL